MIRQAWTTTRFALKRVLTQPLLSLAAVVGLMIASGFIFSVPLYSDAIYFRLFREEVLSGRGNIPAGQPAEYTPLSFVYELQGVGRDSPQWENVLSVDSYLSKGALQQIGLPVMEDVRRFHTDFLYLYPPEGSNPSGSSLFIDTVRMAFITPMENTVAIIHGTSPGPSSLLGGGPVEAMVSETMALKDGIQVGDTYDIRRDNAEIPVAIVGIWRPLDPSAPYWDVTSDSWLMVNEVSYTGSISSVVSDELFSSRWIITFDGSHLFAADIAGLTQNIGAVNQRVTKLQSDTTLISSPLPALARYQKNTPLLTYLLYAFSVPILGLIVVFIGLVTGLFVGGQRSEMAILRSRGASRLQVAWISLLQGILLGAAALAGGVPVGVLIAHGIGRAYSFLNFTDMDALRVGITVSVLAYGLLGIALILLTLFLIPTMGASANTIVTYKKERARLLQPPWWQRFGLDAVLLVPALYGFWVMQRQGTQALKAAQTPSNPLQNPLLLLVPAVGIFALTLLALRLIPILMAVLGRILRATKNVGMLMAARYLSRSPAFYTAPLILLILTLGLSAFTASLARTLDNHLEKQMSYQVGSDLQIYELGTSVNSDPTSPAAAWTFPPVEEHLLLKGVRQATRVGRYTIQTVFSDGVAEGTLLGIDRTTFPQVAYWQTDFASQSLGELMNALGATPDGVLIPASLMRDKKLQIGDPILFSASPGTGGPAAVVKLRVAGTFNLFPTWYPNTGPLFVGNLDTIFLQAGNEYPHEVWLKTDPGVDPEGIVYGVRGYSIMLDTKADVSRLVRNGLNTFVGNWTSAQLNVRAQQERPERQGLFGLLSAGFVASAVLTVLGFLLYALFSFQRRFVEIGMLRAIGLSVRQMIGLLAAELASLILMGIGFGTAFGLLASRLFVPFLQVGASAQAQYPPFQIQIAWSSILEIDILFFALFLIALGALAALLLRMKIFQAIKLGESI